MAIHRSGIYKRQSTHFAFALSNVWRGCWASSQCMQTAPQDSSGPARCPSFTGQWSCVSRLRNLFIHEVSLENTLAKSLFLRSFTERNDLFRHIAKKLQYQLACSFPNPSTWSSAPRAQTRHWPAIFHFASKNTRPRATARAVPKPVLCNRFTRWFFNECVG